MPLGQPFEMYASEFRVSFFWGRTPGGWVQRARHFEVEERGSSLTWVTSVRLLNISEPLLCRV